MDPRVVIEDFLETHELDYERSDHETFLVTLPGERKLQTHCALIIGDYSLSVSAFVMRKPDENLEKVFEWCLKRNAILYGISFALNDLGDVYLVGRLPLSTINESELDRILGSVLAHSDASFNPLLELGFASAIRREWAWRVSRGESLANLQEFKHLI